MEISAPTASEEKNLLSTWTNQDNAEYYERVPVEIFKQYAIRGGLDTGCDMDIIYDDYLKYAPSILEVGASYGRVLKCLLERGYAGKLIAVEKSQHFGSYLRDLYQDKVDIHTCDIENFVYDEPIDVVLWMWSNISEWPKEHQLTMLKHIMSFSKPDGFVIIETISHTTPPINVNQYNIQNYKASTAYGTVQGYIPSIEEVAAYATKIGITEVRHIPYLTSTNRERIIHILRR